MSDFPALLKCRWLSNEVSHMKLWKRNHVKLDEGGNKCTNTWFLLDYVAYASISAVLFCCKLGDAEVYTLNNLQVTDTKLSN